MLGKAIKPPQSLCIMLRCSSGCGQAIDSGVSLQVLVSILEGGDLPGQLLENLLIYLVPPDSTDHPEACR